jgi:hypothetical protein
VAYVQEIVRQAKLTKDPYKYARIDDWAAADGHRSSLPKAPRASIHAEVTKLAKQVPGPAAYPKAGDAKDRYSLPRTDIGISKSGGERYSITECNAYAQ